jgi:biotin synthase-like enzyme
MREAGFEMIFCGIETPEPDALKAIDKAHNMMVPILDSVRTINGYGMEVVSGIIFGLDTDTKDTGRRISEFLEQSKIPMATINLLQALPRTPLWERFATRKPASR